MGNAFSDCLGTNINRLSLCEQVIYLKFLQFNIFYLHKNITNLKNKEIWVDQEREHSNLSKCWIDWRQLNEVPASSSFNTSVFSNQISEDKICCASIFD